MPKLRVSSRCTAYAATALLMILLILQANTLWGHLSLNLRLVHIIHAIAAQEQESQQLARSRLTEWTGPTSIETGRMGDALWIAVGLLNQQMGDDLAAHRAWNKVSQSYDDFIAKAEVYRQDRQYADAIAWYQRALIVRTEDSLAQQLLGAIHHDLGDYAQALPFLQAASVALPNSSLVRAQLCNVYRSLGEPERAVEVFKTANHEYHDDSFLQLCVGKAYWDLVDFATAAEHFQRAVALNPDEAAAHFWLSLALNRLGNREEAISAAVAAIERSPDRPGYSEHLLNLYLVNEDWRLAQDTVDRLLRMDPENAAAHSAIELIESNVRN